MGPLRKYAVEVNGLRTSMWLDKDDADLYGVTESEDEENAPPAAKQRPVGNKARKPRNKGVA